MKRQSKWNSTVSQEGCVADWNAAYTLASRCTKSTTLINFQYWFPHRILPTNSFLTKIGIHVEQDPNCSFCRNTEENLFHLFWHRPNIKTFWGNLTNKLVDFDFIPRDFSKDIADFLGLKSDTTKFALQLNFCFLLAWHYIWGCRTSNKTPQLKMFLKTLRSQYKIELSYKQVSLSKKWNPLVPLFNVNC